MAHMHSSGSARAHCTYLAVHNLHGQIELVDHAQRDGSTARLAVVHLALYQERLDASLGQRLSRARAAGAASDDL